MKMKSEKSTGRSKRVFSVFTHNIGLKILALALAVLVYEMMKMSSIPSPIRNPAPFQNQN